MTIHDSSQIGRIIRDGVAFDPKNWTGGTLNTDSLLRSVKDFFTLLEERKIDYVLVGGVAMLHYIEGRNTQDVDLIMALASLKKLPELIISSQDMYFARASFNELQIDILLNKNPLFKKVQQRYSRSETFQDRSITMASVDGLILLKLYALPSLYRQGNLPRAAIYESDVTILLHTYKPDVAALVNVISNYLSESDLAEVKIILAEIQGRLTRFDQSRSASGQS